MSENDNSNNSDDKVLANKHLFTFYEHGFFIEDTERYCTDYVSYKTIKLMTVTEKGLWVNKELVVRCGNPDDLYGIYNKVKFKWKMSIKENDRLNLVKEMKRLNELLSHLEFVPGSSESFEAKERFEAMSEKVDEAEPNKELDNNK